MRRIVSLLIVMLAISISTKGQTRAPQFKDFPVNGKYTGKNARVIITGEDRMYRTRLREAAQEKPNFAGHYILTAWGCGAGCLMGAVIDANIGKVHWFPHTICCWNEIERDDTFIPIVFRLNSRLIVFTGLRNEQDGDQGAHFYEFDQTGFKFIRTIKSTATQPEVQPKTKMQIRRNLACPLLQIGAKWKKHLHPRRPTTFSQFVFWRPTIGFAANTRHGFVPFRRCYRAMLFHLGALRRLNEVGLLRGLVRISSVSGRSITAAVLGLQWKQLQFNENNIARNLDELVINPIRRLADDTIDEDRYELI